MVADSIHARPDDQVATWFSNNHVDWASLDHVLVPARLRGAVVRCGALPRPLYHDTDHALVTLDFQPPYAPRTAAGRLRPPTTPRPY